MATDVDRLLLNTARRQKRVRWSQRDIAALEDMVGRYTPVEMAHRLGRSLNSVKCKLTALGYVIGEDVRGPLGLSVIGVARRLGAPYEVVWRIVRAGLVKARRYEGRKDYLIEWPEVRRIERRLAGLRVKRERVLDRIGEPTITKQEFMRLIGLSETQATRYLQGGIVRAWKVPCKWSTIGRDRWDWLVSKRDAQRVKRQREQGRLRLGRRRFRDLVARESAKVVELRRAGRLGRSRRQPRPCPAPGHLSPAQIAQQSGGRVSQ